MGWKRVQPVGVSSATASVLAQSAAAVAAGAAGAAVAAAVRWGRVGDASCRRHPRA